MTHYIPNIFHFINLGPRQLNFLHFLSIFSAVKHNKPSMVYFYYTHDQPQNPFWKILQNQSIFPITFEQIDEIKEFHGQKIESYQYQADIIRLQKLIKYGGVYLDLDVLTLQSFSDFVGDVSFGLVLGAEGCDDPESTDINKISSFTNAVIIAESNNKFLQDWLDILSKNMGEDRSWAYHAVVLPKMMYAVGTGKLELEIETKDETKDETDISEQEKTKELFDWKDEMNWGLHKWGNIKIEPRRTFMPFCFRKYDIFEKNINEISETLDANIYESYTIHLWETIWWDQWISKIDVKYFEGNNCWFARVFEQYLAILYENMENIKDAIGVAFAMDDWNSFANWMKLWTELCKRNGIDTQITLEENKWF